MSWRQTVAVLRRQTTRMRGVVMETVALVSRQTPHVMTSRFFVVSRLRWWCRRYDRHGMVVIPCHNGRNDTYTVYPYTIPYDASDDVVHSLLNLKWTSIHYTIKSRQLFYDRLRMLNFRWIVWKGNHVHVHASFSVNLLHYSNVYWCKT